MLLLAFATTL